MNKGRDEEMLKMCPIRTIKDLQGKGLGALTIAKSIVSIEEASEKQRISDRMIRTLCAEGELKGRR